MNFSMNILHDIDILFIALAHIYYLVFFRRLKHGSPWLDELFQPTQRRHLRPRREHMVLRLREGLPCSRLHTLVVLDVTVEGPQRHWQIRF
jgi:hypothetical protein